MGRIGWVCLVASTLLLAGCVRISERGEDLSENRMIDAGGAEFVQVRLEMGAGELRLEGGAAKLLDADFHYNFRDQKPVVRYNVAGSRGYLTIRQPPVTTLGANNNRYIWDLHMNDRMPLDLHVDMGAGQGTFNLAGTSVRRLEVNVGAGQVDLNLNGPWEEDLDARVHGGVGEATVRLPRDVGVRVKASGGIGEIHVRGLQKYEGYYVNDAFHTSGARIRLNVSGGIGQINLIG
jgi:hypothetical protein